MQCSKEHPHSIMEKTTLHIAEPFLARGPQISAHPRWRAAESLKFANAKHQAIFTLVSGPSRCWYAVMQAEEQNCMCQ